MSKTSLIKDLDLSVVAEHLQERHNWSKEKTQTEINNYKIFLEDVLRGELGSPSKGVDAVWHTHILFTKKYREDCQNIFGAFIDHEPLTAPTVQVVNKALCQPTKALCQPTKNKALCQPTRNLQVA